MKEVVFVPWVLSPQGAAILIHSLPMKNAKKYAHDVFYTFATYPGLLCDDVTDTDCWAQNSSTHSCVL